MEEERCTVSLHPRNMQKKHKYLLIKQIQGKMNETKFILYLLRSGDRLRLPDSISLITSCFSSNLSDSKNPNENIFMGILPIETGFKNFLR
jgi:hypothetical protein